MVFTVIGDVAFSTDSLIAVADRHSCSVIFIDVPSDSTWSVGQCGGGPNEFLDPTAVSFFGDILWVYDFDRRRLASIDPYQAQVTGAFSIDDMLGPGSIAGIIDIAAVGPDDLLLGLFRRPPTADRHGELVALLDVKSRQVTEMGIGDPRISLDTEFSHAPSAKLCGSDDGFWAVANEWTPQVTGFDRLGSAPAFDRHLGGREWWTPTVMQNDPARLIPPLPAPEIVCDGRTVLIDYKRRKRVEGKSTILQSRLVALDTTGSILLDEEIDTPMDGTPQAFTLGAILGDLVVTYTSRFADFPTVRLHRMTREPTRR